MTIGNHNSKVHGILAGSCTHNQPTWGVRVSVCMSVCPYVCVNVHVLA